MKKWAIVFLTLSVLTACGSEDNNPPEETSTEQSEQGQAEEVSAEVNEDEEQAEEPAENNDGKTVLTEVGQEADVELGHLELLNIKSIDETFDIAPLKITMGDMKVFKLTDIPDDVKEGIEYYDENPVGDELVYLQVSYNVENVEEQDIEWFGLQTVVTDKGQQIDAVGKDFIITDADTQTTFYGKVKKEFTDAYVLKHEDVSKLKFIFSYTQEAETYDTITDEKQVEYTF